MTSLKEAQRLVAKHKREREQKSAVELKAAQEWATKLKREREQKRAAGVKAAQEYFAKRDHEREQKKALAKEAQLEPIRPVPEPRILVIDIETSPIEGYVWGTYDQNLSLEQIKTDWTILSYAAKWLDKPGVIYQDTSGRGADKVRDDSILLPGLQRLMTEADLVIAQNGVKFDIKKINWRLAERLLLPPSPVRVIDTLRTSRRMFAATSHKLAWLSEKLTDTPKSRHRKFPGWELWLECLKDNPVAWREMRLYNCQDIRATEKVYLRQRPWMPNHPNLAVYAPGVEHMCPRCRSTDVKQSAQLSTTQASLYRRYQCGSCGGWSRGKDMLSSVEKRRSLLVPE